MSLHPLFQEALAPFAPLLSKDGTASSPAMAQLFNVACKPLNLPRCGEKTLDIFLSTIESSIALIGPLECRDVARILNALRLQMAASGFSKVDIDTMQEVTDFVCGESA